MATMSLTVAVPERMLLETEIAKLTVDGPDGSFCLLPNHIDYATPLAVGIASYVDPAGGERFIALDRGILVKRDDEVRMSVRRAVVGGDLATLEETVRTTYRQQTREEKEARRASAQLQANFVRRFLDLEEELP